MTRTKTISLSFILRVSNSDGIDSHNSITYFQIDAIISECRLLKRVAKFISITGWWDNLTSRYVDE